MGILDRSYAKVSEKRFLIQSDVLLANMFGILREASTDVNDSEGLDALLAVPLSFETDAFDASVAITFESAARVPDINLLVERNVSRRNGADAYAPQPLNPVLEEYLDRILTVYNVSDKILFLSMVADTIDADLEERVAGSEVALKIRTSCRDISMVRRICARSRMRIWA